MINPIKAAFRPGRTRLGRLDYLFSWITSMLILGMAAVITMVILAVVFAASVSTVERADGLMNGAMPLVTLLLIMPASIYTGAILGAKRLHDMDRTGRWMILYYLCYATCLVVNFMALSRPGLSLVADALNMLMAVALLLLVVIPGTAGENRYGPVPPKF